MQHTARGVYNVYNPDKFQSTMRITERQKNNNIGYAIYALYLMYSEVNIWKSFWKIGKCTMFVIPMSDFLI